MKWRSPAALTLLRITSGLWATCWRACLGIALVVALAGLGRSGWFDAPPRMRLGAWVTSWALAQGLQRAVQTPQGVSDVYFFVASLTPEGRVAISPQGCCAEEVAALRRQGVRSWLTVVNDVVRGAKPALLKDPAAIRALIGDEHRQAAHIRELIQAARAGGFGGIDIDYENLFADDRGLFSQFVERLAAQAKRSELQLSVTVQPKTRPSRSAGPGAADWSRLCKSADRLVIMLYNQHNAKTPPGPVASLAWIEEVLAYAEQQCSRQRLVPALKVSGFRWAAEGVRGVVFDEATRLAEGAGASILRAPDRTPYFHLGNGASRSTVYYEDAESLAYKADRIAGRGYRDLVLWSLGREDPALVAELQRVLSGKD